MCQSKHDQALPPFEDYDLTDADNVFYIEAKRLLNNGYRNQFNMFMRWASGYFNFDLAAFVMEHDAFIDCMVYGVTEDDARELATTALEQYNDEIMSRLESGVITSEMEY